jgi:hypothetical protein
MLRHDTYRKGRRQTEKHSNKWEDGIVIYEYFMTISASSKGRIKESDELKRIWKGSFAVKSRYFLGIFWRD